MDIAKLELHEDFSYNNLKSFSLTIPTGSVKSERSISALRRVFNYNRTTTQLNRLGQMSLLAIESDILESITNNDAIDYFASLKPRKISLVENYQIVTTDIRYC